MKKTVATMTALLILCLTVFVGCSKTDELTGTTWTITSAQANGQTVNQADYEEQMGGKSTISFEANSKYTMVAGKDKSSDSYTLDGKKIVIYEGSKKYNGTYDSSKKTISLTVDTTTLNFTKQ